MQPAEEGCLQRLFRMTLWVMAVLLVVAVVLVVLGRRPIRINV